MAGERFPQHRHHALVDLDRGHRAGTFGKLRGEHAGTGPDLEDVVAGRELSGIEDGAEDAAVDEETLAERGRGAHAMPAQDALEGARVGDVHRRSLSGCDYLQLHCAACPRLNM